MFDPLTKAQQKHLKAIGDRISHSIDPDGPCPGSIYGDDAHPQAG